MRGRRRSGNRGDGTEGEVEAAECAVPLKEWPALTSPTYRPRLRGGRNGLMARAASHNLYFPFAQVLVQELEEHQVRSPFGERRRVGGDGREGGPVGGEGLGPCGRLGSGR